MTQPINQSINRETIIMAKSNERFSDSPSRDMRYLVERLHAAEVYIRSTEQKGVPPHVTLRLYQHWRELKSEEPTLVIGGIVLH